MASPRALQIGIIEGIRLSEGPCTGLQMGLIKGPIQIDIIEGIRLGEGPRPSLRVGLIKGPYK